MRRWMWYGAALLLVVGLSKLPFLGIDVAKLQPVEVVRLSKSGGRILVETDTGAAGRGGTLAEAFGDLEETAVGKIFLDTADYLIVSPECVAYIGKMGDYLRPGCEICAVAGSVELGMAADYLRAHSPGLTLKDARTGEKTLPVLIGREGRMEFAGR